MFLKVIILFKTKLFQSYSYNAMITNAAPWLCYKISLATLNNITLTVE